MGRSDGLLSWNMGCGEYAKFSAAQQTSRLDVLKAIVADRNPAIIALQEAPSQPDIDVALGWKYSSFQTVRGVSIAHDTQRWSCDYNDVSETRLAVAGLKPIGASMSVWVFNIHCPALFVSDAEKQTHFLSSVPTAVAQRRISDAFRQEIVCGDLNMAPFAAPIVRPEGLHANRSLKWAKGKGGGLQKRMFNATWKIMANHDGACGTLYSKLDIDGPWHAIDQVIVSAPLADDSSFSVEVIETTSGHSSLRKPGPIGAPDPKVGSDHLPIFAKIHVG